MSSEIKDIFIPRAAKSLYFEAMKASKPNYQERRGKEGVGEEGEEKRENEILREKPKAQLNFQQLLWVCYFSLLAS